MSLSDAFLDELRARTSLSQLVGKSVPLKKAGREMKGCCPFHSEKTPSFYVNDDKAFYHCFGCSAHGDAIRWMTDHEGLPFMDAVKTLAAAAGLEMPARDTRNEQRDREQEEMLSIMAAADRYYRANLESDAAGVPAREYLNSRMGDYYGGDFGIGWSTTGRDRDELHRLFKPEHHPLLVKVGLAKFHEDGPRKGEIYDFFRGRMMFPIHDARGRVIGFGGRVLGDGQPKYLNSPDTPIFDKGRTLYNLHRAAPPARRANRLIVVEGYMDVIGMASAGILECVAPNGTALTEHQIAGLWRIVGTPLLCFDGDKAGKAAAARAALKALPLLEPDKSLAFVFPPEGQDPDDVARKGGKEAVEAMLAVQTSLVDLVWRHERDAAPLDTPEQVAGFRARLRAHVRSIRNSDVREAYGQHIAKLLKGMFDAEANGTGTVRPMMRPGRERERRTFAPRPAPQTAQSRAIGNAGLASPVERAILCGLLRHPEVVETEIEIVALAKFKEPRLAILRDAMLDGSDLSAFESTIALCRSTRLQFSFVTGQPTARSREELVDALTRLR